jgi:hypothetical protein
MSEETTTEALPDPTYFEGRYPTLEEMLSKGGLAGVEYCLVSGSRQKLFAEMKDDNGFSWSPIRDMPILTIAGPKGTVESVVLMGRGEPIRGAGDYNGIRHYFVDIALEEAVGIPANSESPVANLVNTPKPEVKSDAHASSRKAT